MLEGDFMTFKLRLLGWGSQGKSWFLFQMYTPGHFFVCLHNTFCSSNDRPIGSHSRLHADHDVGTPRKYL